MTLTVSVTDERGQFVDGLPRNAFTVTENKKPLEIVSFNNDDVPISIGVLFDASGSIRELGKERIAAVKEALATFARESHPANEYFLMSFNNSAQLLMDWTTGERGFTEALAKLPSTDKDFKDSTAFNDACLLALEKLASHPAQKRVLLVISDGLDNSSRHSFKELRETLKHSDVNLYAIAFAVDNLNSVNVSLSLYESQAILEELTWRTGGMPFFPPKIVAMNSAFETIERELRHQYSVGIQPAALPDKAGKWHTLKVTVAPLRVNDRDVKLRARAREGYYAP